MADIHQSLGSYPINEKVHVLAPGDYHVWGRVKAIESEHSSDAEGRYTITLRDKRVLPSVPHTIMISEFGDRG